MFSLALIPLLLLATVNGQSDSTTDCSKLDFTKLPATCCAAPFGPVFKLSDIPAACKSSASKYLPWLNSYMLNELQDPTMGNFIDPKSKSYLSTICGAAKFVECVFDGKGYTFGAEFDQTPIYNLMKGLTTNSDWKSTLYYLFYPFVNSIYKFTDITEDNFETAACPSGSQYLVPLMFMQMIQSELIWMCPTLNPFTDSNKCMKTMKDFQYCDGKIYSPTAKGIFFFPQT